jgi:hypothetical protein
MTHARASRNKGSSSEGISSAAVNSRLLFVSPLEYGGFATSSYASLCYRRFTSRQTESKRKRIDVFQELCRWTKGYDPYLFCSCLYIARGLRPPQSVVAGTGVSPAAPPLSRPRPRRPASAWDAARSGESPCGRVVR